MSMRTAIMEMYGAKKVKREAWVPESILDDDVSHFMGAAAAAKKAGKSHFDFGGKKYKVTMKSDAAKKIGESAGCPECGADGECQCEQPVQEAKVDELSTKTMKSYVKKASKQRDKAGDSYSSAAARRHDFAPDTPAMKKNAIKYNKRDSGVDMAQKKLAARESVEQVDEVSYKTAMKSYQKAMGQSKDADDAGDKETGDKKFDQAVKFGRYATKKFKSSRNKKKLVRSFSGKESVEEAKVDELSKKTYKSYFKKADLSQRDAERKLKDVRSKRDIFAKPGGQERKLINTIKKRNRGMDDARDRIANKESVEEAVSVKKKDYKWGRMMTVHHGTSHSYPLHPEHQSAIKKLGDDQKTSFKDETGTKVTAHRQGDTVHLSSSKTNKKTPVAHSHFKESVEENYTDKQDASYREPPVKSLKKLKQRRAAEKGKKRPDPLRNAKPIKFESVEEKMDPKDHVKYNDEMEMYCVYNKDGKVVAKFKDQEDANNYAMKNHDDLMEAAGTAQHKPTPETSDTFEKQMNNGEGGIPMGKKKDFVNQHNMEVAYDAEELYKQNKYEALSKTPARPGDKSDGDKNVVNPIPTNMVDGMRAALAKMKNSGE